MLTNNHHNLFLSGKQGLLISHFTFHHPQKQFMYIGMQFGVDNSFSQQRNQKLKVTVFPDLFYGWLPYGLDSLTMIIVATALT